MYYIKLKELTDDKNGKEHWFRTDVKAEIGDLVQLALHAYEVVDKRSIDESSIVDSCVGDFGDTFVTIVPKIKKQKEEDTAEDMVNKANSWASSVKDRHVLLVFSEGEDVKSLINGNIRELINDLATSIYNDKDIETVVRTAVQLVDCHRNK